MKFMLVYFTILWLTCSIVLGQDCYLPAVEKENRICFAMYTVHENTLKLTAQLYPLDDYDNLDILLEIKKGEKWQAVDEARIDYPGWTARFRVENWDMAKDYMYRVNFHDQAYYEGIIRKDPVEKDVVTVAAFTGNSTMEWHGGNIPKDDIVENLKKIKPDLLFFSGDQVYNHNNHFKFWLRFGEDFGDIIRNTPTVCIPDDHDVGHANLWGEGGIRSQSRAGDDGGYYMPVSYINEVERAQTSHLPDPYDPAPVQNGIGVYYTSLNVGGVDFAILEDRKFKTGPKGRVQHHGPRPDHIDYPDYDPAALDIPDAILLGDRQLKFLREWAADWYDAEMKAVLSQTIFCMGAHIHGKTGYRLYADLDSNGWPQSGRNRALAEMRKAFAFHIAGDQHLATVFHHGIDEWNDAGYSFCVPSIANYYLRWWEPLEPGKNRKPGMPDYLGEFTDGFNNKITLHAVANPSKEPNGGKHLTTRAAGYGIIKFNKQKRTITMECWPRNTDITNPVNAPYDGWPATIDQMDNYGRAAKAWLPKLKIENKKDPIIQVIDEENSEVIYTVRIKGQTFRPKVFKEGKYTIRLFDTGYNFNYNGIEADLKASPKEIVVR